MSMGEDFGFSLLNFFFLESLKIREMKVLDDYFILEVIDLNRAGWI